MQHVAENSEEGYILSVDLEYSDELHDLHSNYPLAPEFLEVKASMLSPYQRVLELGERLWEN